MYGDCLKDCQYIDLVLMLNTDRECRKDSQYIGELTVDRPKIESVVIVTYHI